MKTKVQLIRDNLMENLDLYLFVGAFAGFTIFTMRGRHASLEIKPE